MPTNAIQRGEETRAATHVPLELYLRTEYEPPAEYVDGVLEELHVGKGKHCDWQAAITTWFLNHRNEWNIGVRPEYYTRTQERHYRLPDVSVLERAFMEEEIATHPALAVFEILSLDDTYKRLMVKLREYAEMGVAAIYVVDPDTGVFERFEQGQLARREEFSLPERGIEFAFAEIAKLVS